MRIVKHAAAVLAIAFVGSVALAAPNAELESAEKDVKAALKEHDLGALDKAIQGLRGLGGVAAAEMLIEYAKKSPPGADELYWRFAYGAASMRDREGLDAVAKVIVKEKTPLARDLLYAMQNNRSFHVPVAVHALVLDKGAIDLALMSADQLAGIESVEAVDVLIAAFKDHEKKDDELSRRLLMSLEYLTGANMGAAANWIAWWETARKDGLKRERGEGRTGTALDHIDDPRVQEIGKIGKVLVMTAECTRGDSGINFDDIGALLEQMKIPYTGVTKVQFEKGEVNLDGVAALLITCTQLNPHCVCKACIPGGGNKNNRMTSCTGCNNHILENHKLSNAAIDKIKAWVERGGYLFTEDWGIADMAKALPNPDKPPEQGHPFERLEPTWAGTIQRGKKMTSRSVRVVPARGQSSHPLLRGVFLDPVEVKKSEDEGGEGGTVTRGEGEEALAGKVERFWTIDDESPYVEVVGPTKVTVLMSSPDLGKEYGESNGSVAVTFLAGGQAGEKSVVAGELERVRGGRVLHVLSHFGKQNTENDAFALQNLLLNFLIESGRRAKKV